LRNLVQQAFVPRRLKALEGDIEQAVDKLLDAVVGHGRMDVVADYARPLPVWVISSILDVPEPDREHIQELAQDSSLTLDMEYLSNEATERALNASIALQDYFRDFVEARRISPGDDVLSGMIAAEESGEVLSNDEIVAMADLLFVAGHETTVNLIGNGTRAMLDHEGSLERKDNAHLTFSIGPHVCLGAFLARMEARIAWRRMLERITDISSRGPSRYREHVTLRGLESVDIAFTAAS
jgi:cytochrome P450